MQDALAQLEALVNEEEMQDLAGVDMSALPEEFRDAAAMLLGGGATEPAGVGPEGPPEEVGATGGEDGGLGRGPYPEGAAPQTIAPRGLGTPKEQPQPVRRDTPAPKREREKVTT